MSWITQVTKESYKELPPFHPFLSVIDAHTNNLAKFMLPLLPPSTANEYTVIDLFHFAEDNCPKDPNLCMASLNVGYLF